MAALPPCTMSTTFAGEGPFGFAQVRSAPHGLCQLLNLRRQVLMINLDNDVESADGIP
jgi:hypothetical protein